MKRTFFRILVICLCLVPCLSCNKNRTDEHQTQILQAGISNLYETVSNDVFKIFLYSVLAMNDSLFHPGDAANFRLPDPCIAFNLNSTDTTTWPKTLQIIFPAGNCQGYDGINRTGRMIIEMPAASFPLHSKFTINFDNYSVGGALISGYKKIYMTGIDGYSFTDSSFLQINTTEALTDWSAVHHLQWVLGNSSHTDIADDLFIYNGTALCSTPPTSSSYDLGFKINIIEALQFANYCFWIGSGKTEIIAADLPISTVTYSDSCINQATITIDNEFQNISF
ncbi:MAG TPA: hypothetical protein PKW80_10890 [Bacteroidales bacterium]|nr:hypothetical protein [Bacteroidales bacterium]